MKLTLFKSKILDKYKIKIGIFAFFIGYFVRNIIFSIYDKFIITNLSNKLSSTYYTMSLFNYYNKLLKLSLIGESIIPTFIGMFIMGYIVGKGGTKFVAVVVILLFLIESLPVIFPLNSIPHIFYIKLSLFLVIPFGILGGFIGEKLKLKKLFNSPITSKIKPFNFKKIIGIILSIFIIIILLIFLFKILLPLKKQKFQRSILTPILSSSNGVIWINRSSEISNSFSAITYGNEEFVAVGNAILTSSNGKNWIKQNSGTIAWLNGIVYGKKKFVAVGDNGTILTSSNGKNWVKQNSKTINSIRGITYGNNEFIAVGGNYSPSMGNSYGIIITSVNGKKWINRNSGISNNLFAITYGGGKFVAVGDTILTSYNGKTWQKQNLPIISILNSITYGDGKFVAVGGAYQIIEQNPYGVIITSLNGIKWTKQNLRIPNVLNGITYGNNIFVTVGNNFIK